MQLAWIGRCFQRPGYETVPAMTFQDKIMVLEKKIDAIADARPKAQDSAGNESSSRER